MKPSYTAPAARDLARILDYLTDRSPQGARRVKSEINKAIELICRHPAAGTPTRRSGMRRLVVAHHPYLVFYRVRDDTIVIHAIRHAARRPSSMPGE